MSFKLFLNRAVVQQNYQALKQFLNHRKLSMTVVTKVLQSHPALMKLLGEMEIDCVADSYAENIYSRDFKECWNLCISSPHKVASIMQHSNLSVHSCFETLEACKIAALEANISHEVLLMIDMGDWREGFPINYLKDHLNRFDNLQPLKLRGLAINLSCFAGVKLSFKHIQQLIEVAQLIRQKHIFSMLSLGNSAALPILESWNPDNWRIWNGIDWNVRIGEALFCGTLPGTGQSILGLQNAFRLRLPVVEAHHKSHSLDQEELVPNSFGELRRPIQKGSHQRIIIGAGRVDFDPQYLQFSESLELLGSSSDLSVFINRGTPLRVGDEIDCVPQYHAVMHLAISNRMQLEVL